MTVFGKKQIADVSKILIKTITFVCVILVLQSCFLNHDDIDCSENVVKTSNSPDNAYVAVIMVENCHVTNPLMTHVNIRSVGKEFSKNPNTNRVEEGQVFRIRNDFPDSKIEWINERKLKISCNGCVNSRISVKKERFEEIDIVYDLH
jgi:hypothetical protein